MKTYHSYQGECKQAEMKLRSAESQRTKLQQSLSPDKLTRSKKFKMIEQEVKKVYIYNKNFKTLYFITIF